MLIYPVDIYLRPDGYRVRSAADGATGPGTSGEGRPHVFDSLYVARIEESGSGSGLTIGAELTEVMGGTMSVTARRPTGTRFTVHLPATEQ